MGKGLGQQGGIGAQAIRPVEPAAHKSDRNLLLSIQHRFTLL
jgi:hypothetical protein